jgi:hypothetical protein
MIPLIGSLCMGLSAGVLFWATIRLGRRTQAEAERAKSMADARG